jgi:hypothetical protein
VANDTEPNDLPADMDLGAPIAELRDLGADVDPRFARRVRGRIERRLFSSDIIAFWWTTPLMVLIEILRIPFDLIDSRRR